MEFRRDINGLRAVAVVLVVLFHFGVAGMGGGFLGVDVFFVISGFLMTSIIYTRLDQSRFSLVAFYLDRCRRIVPALAVLCLALLIVGWFLLLPGDYEELGTQVLASLSFVSNLLFWKQDGYFEQASHDKWLLHTWSLSIEWQFYLIYPVLIMLLRKLFAAGAVRWWLLAAALASFALSVFAAPRWGTSAFFLLPTRGWEMLAGGLVYLFPLRLSRAQSRVLEVSGILLILACALLIGEQTTWPGWLAAIPVLGTVMVVYAARGDSFLTTNPVSQFLGRTSYSLYLWHWPMAVWLFYFGLEHEVGWVALAMALSVLAAWFSFTWVESLGGRRRGARPAPVAPRLAMSVPLGLAAALGAVTLASSGFPDRMSDAFRQSTADLVMPWKQTGWCFHSVETFDELSVGEEGLGCTLGEPEAQTSGLLFGDSFAGHYDPFWDTVAGVMPARLESVSTDWCYPSLSDAYTGPETGRGYQQCLFNRAFLKQNLERYDFVVFAGQWGVVHDLEQMQGVGEVIDLAARRVPLVVIMPAPLNFDVNVKNMYERSLMLGTEFEPSRFRRERDIAARAANRQLELWAEAYPNVVFLNRRSLFHVDGVASPVTADNVPFSLDESGHISVYGSKMAARAFLETPAFRQFTQLAERLRKDPSRQHYAGAR